MNEAQVAHFPAQGSGMPETSNLTKSQLQIWMGQKLRPGIPIYNMMSTFTIKGEVNPAHFQRSFQALIDRSDALRTVIVEREGIPQQHVASHLPYKMEYLDFSEKSDPEPVLEDWLKQRSIVSLKPDERLFDCALIKISSAEFVWYLNQHHVIADAWATSLIYRRMAEFYTLSLEYQIFSAPDLPSFREYVDFEKVYRNSPKYQSDESYWQQKLAKPIEPGRFYSGISSTTTTQTQRISHNLGSELSEKLRAIALEDDLSLISPHQSLFCIFATILFTYLYRINGNRELTIGTPIHNRSNQKFKETIGIFMSVCPLQVEIDEDETFLSLLKKVKTELHTTLPHARYSPGNPVHHRAYDILLNYHTISFPDFCGFPMRHRRIHSGHWEDSTSLSIEIFDQSRTENFLLLFDFNVGILEEEQQHRALQHFLNILDGFVSDPAQPIRRVKLLSNEERQQVLVTSNNTYTDFPREACIHQLIECQVERTPGAIAATYNGEHLTYQELNQQANQLAHYLRKSGVGPDTLVAICMERSLKMIVGLLGILKAGGAYVPIDPAFPADRCAFMLSDSQATVLLTEQSLLGAIPEQSAQVICLDTDWPAIHLHSQDNPVSGVRSGQMAYVIYTSGSTGKPKGVQIPHRAVVNFLSSMRKQPGITDQDVLFAVTTLSFDIAVLELFLPLNAGAQVFLIGRETATDGKLLLQALERSGATLMQATPATWRLLLDAGWQGDKRLKVLCGGEALPRELANQLLERCGSLWNMYGPTETTVWSALDRVEFGDGPVRIGHPIANTQLYVLDPQLEPLPVGVPGELYIGGDGLALGYLNQPELTSEKFIPHPFSDQPGARLYKTGDLARFLPDGALICLGRSDHQVKIRGFRIELGEIEAVLAGHPAVENAAVIAREDIPGRKRLVAYVVATDGSDLTIQELRRFIKEKLPDYMLPSAFVFMNALPLTPNRKVDRRALPDPELAERIIERTFVEPEDEIQLRLTKIWEEVLNREPVGLRDNFFELGGDSLLAAVLFYQIEQIFGTNLPQVTVLNAPTVEELADIIKKSGGSLTQVVGDQTSNGSKEKKTYFLHKVIRTIASKLNPV